MQPKPCLVFTDIWIDLGPILGGWHVDFGANPILILVRGYGRPKMTWKQLTERNCREWKLLAINLPDRHTWRSGLRSAMPAASQLPGRGPLIWMLPLYLLINKKSGDDDDPVGVGIGVGATHTFLHNILLTSGWILTKFSYLYNWDISKKWKDFGDFDLIIKVTAEGTLKILSGEHLFSLKTLLLVMFLFLFVFFVNVVIVLFL